MEEILASIRRIIADEGGPQEEAKPAPAAKPPAPGGDPAKRGPMTQSEVDALLNAAAKTGEGDVLELTQAVEPAGNGFRPIGPADVVFREPSESPPAQQAAAPARPAPAPRPQATPNPRAGSSDLLSPGTAATVTTAFASLTNTILSEHARTLEDLVKEMMRPMLKEWLDNNLPDIVERMVRAEIERVTRVR